MSIIERIGEMLKSDELDVDIALRLILELLTEDRRVLADVEARQLANPSCIWFLRHKTTAAVPVIALVVVLMSWFSTFLTPDIVVRYLAAMLGFDL